MREKFEPGLHYSPSQIPPILGNISVPLGCSEDENAVWDDVMQPFDDCQTQLDGPNIKFGPRFVSAKQSKLVKTEDSRRLTRRTGPSLFEQIPILRFSVLIVLSTVLVGMGGLGGCSPFKSKKKEAFAEQLSENIENGKAILIGDNTNIGNNHLIEVQGFGLVKGLANTGSNDVNTLPWQMVYDEMIKIGVRDPKGVMADPSTTVVFVHGYIRAGAQENDFFDVDVIVPEGSDTKSLRGGWLMKTSLREIGVFGDGMHKGSPLAYVEGPIMVDPFASETENSGLLKKGHILGGARVKDSRQLFLAMKEGNESAFVTKRFSDEINHRFYVTTGQKRGVATAKTDTLITLDIHPTYRDDVSRYIKIIQSIACYENSSMQLKRIERLKSELLNPATSQKAAFQLEAIGKKGIPSLQNALKSENTEVRFHAATSLAYLGDGSPAKVLMEIALNEPAFRVYALGALSVMQNDVDAEACLHELLQSPSAETRYGAFRALWIRNSYDRMIRGENLGNQFSYHGIPSKPTPFVHVTNCKRPEIVLFGTDTYLKTPFAIDAGPFIFVNGQNPSNIVVSKFTLNAPDEKRAVSNKLDEIIRAVVDLGGTYPDVVQMLSQADRIKVLSCRLEVDKLPEANRVYTRSTTNEIDETAEEPVVAKKTIWEQLNPKNMFKENPGGKSSDYEGTPNFSARE